MALELSAVSSNVPALDLLFFASINSTPEALCTLLVMRFSSKVLRSMFVKVSWYLLRMRPISLALSLMSLWIFLVPGDFFLLFGDERGFALAPLVATLSAGFAGVAAAFNASLVASSSAPDAPDATLAAGLSAGSCSRAVAGSWVICCAVALGPVAA